MKGREIIDQVYGQIRCAKCRHRIRGNEVTAEERKGNALYVFVKCARCDVPGLLVVTDTLVGGPQRDEPPPFTADDVLDAHDALRDMKRLPTSIGKGG